MARAMKDSGIEWIGEIPVLWNMGRTKNCYTNHKDVVGDKADDYERLALTLGGVIKRPKDDSTGLQPEAFNGYQILRENELVFKLIDLANVSTSRVGYSPYTGIVSPAYIILKPRETSESEFGVYYFLSMWQSEIFNHIGDDGVRSALNASDLLNIPYPIVPKEERKKIVDFLDAKCAEIDRVVAETEKTIEEYKALKQSIITEAVTKGVRGDRPMKDSGIEWIGEIPEEWEILSLGQVTQAMRNGYVGPTKDIFVDAGIRYLQSLHIKDGSIIFSNGEYYVSPEWAEQRPKVHTNDILIVQTGDIGQVGLVTAEYDNCNCHALIIATPNTSLSFPKYLTYYLRSTVGRELLLFYKTGALLPHLNSGKIKFAATTCPPIDEQQEIVSYLDIKCAEIDKLIEAKQQLLAEMETYKKSVIYEYVTGKKEVAE